MLLVASISKMLKDRVHVINDLQSAERLLVEFVKNVKNLYGEHELTYNVHQLLHLSLSVKRWGPLWATSAFMFENENGILARIVHGKSNMGQELVNNLQLIEAVKTLKYKIYKPEVVNFQFKVLGKKLNPRLSNDEIEIFVFQNFKVEDLIFYSRALIKNELFTSLLYKVTKANNYTVKLEINGLQYYGSIRFFFKKAENNYLALKNFNIDENNYFINHETESAVEHFLPIEKLNTYVIVQIENIESIKHVIRVGSYVCLRPNLYNVVF